MKSIALFLSVTFLMGISFIYGARQGAETFLLKEAKFRASMTTYYLEYLDQEKYGALRSSLDTELDLFLVQHLQGESAFMGFLFPELDDRENRALRNAASYRLENPGDTFTEKSLSNLDAESEAYYRSLKAPFQDLIQQYGQ